MTSGYMECPKCDKEFQYAGYDNNGEWFDYLEPWLCKNCQSLIIVNKEQGYGLKIV